MLADLSRAFPALGSLLHGMRRARLADPREGHSPPEVGFDGTSFLNLPTAMTSYEWNPEDGATATEPVLVHAYEEKDPCCVTLAVTDDDGRTPLGE